MVEKANALKADAAAGWHHSAIAVDDYINGDYEHALAMMRQDPDQHAYYIYIEYVSVYGQLGLKQDALEAWRKLLEEEPGASAETFENWYRMWNMRDEDIAKLMDGSTSRACLGWTRSPASDPGRLDISQEYSVRPGCSGQVRA